MYRYCYWHVVEPVKAEARPVPPGVRASKLFLTNLFNTTLPLIRYEIRDQVTLIDEPCSCGSTFRRVEDIEGRLYDVFTYEGGITIHPYVILSAIDRYPSVVEFQVRQTAHGVSILLVANDGSVKVQQIESDVQKNLMRAGLHGAEVSANIVEGLERTAGVAKLRRFIPLS